MNYLRPLTEIPCTNIVKALTISLFSIKVLATVTKLTILVFLSVAMLMRDNLLPRNQLSEITSQ